MRHFFDCPLEGAFMALYHGFKFTTADGVRLESISNYWKAKPTNFPHHWYKANEQRGYLHPNSIKLLEPRVGDLMIHNLSNHAKYVICDESYDRMDNDVYKYTNYFTVAKAIEYLCDYRIGVRNDKPFITPKIESNYERKTG